MMRNSTRKTTDKVVMMPSTESRAVGMAGAPIEEGDIARRAFELYCDRGRQDGRDVEDWLTAEREFREGADSPAA